MFLTVTKKKNTDDITDLFLYCGWTLNTIQQLSPEVYKDKFIKIFADYFADYGKLSIKQDAFIFRYVMEHSYNSIYTEYSNGKSS